MPADKVGMHGGKWGESTELKIELDIVARARARVCVSVLKLIQILHYLALVFLQY